MRPNPTTFETLISKPRLDSYRGYFHASVDEAIGLYMWNGAVSDCLGTIIAYYEIALRIYEVNAIRNRIAHHEPLWKFPAVKDTTQSPPAVVTPESLNTNDSITRFRNFIAQVDAGIASLSTDLAKDISNSSWRKELDFLLTDRGIGRYRSLRHVPAQGAMTPAQLHKKYSLVGKANQAVRIGGRSRFGGVFIPD